VSRKAVLAVRRRAQVRADSVEFRVLEALAELADDSGVVRLFDEENDEDLVITLTPGGRPISKKDDA
jgi:hypothetical protein